MLKTSSESLPSTLPTQAAPAPVKNPGSKKPKLIALTVQAELRASHSLAGFETPHFHLFKVAATFQTELPLVSDRVIDLVFLQDRLHEILNPLSGAYLNEVLSLSPTSENLALWVWDQLTHMLPTEPLQCVEVTLCSLDGVASGSARIWA